MICDECETVAHCMKNGCVPKHQALERMAENARELGLDYEQYKNAIEVSVIFHEGQRMFAVLKQPAQQEPVAWIVEDQSGERLEWASDAHSCHGVPTFPLYTSPPTLSLAQRQARSADTWVGLTDEEMHDLEKQFNAERVRTSDEEYLAIYPSDYWAWQRAIEAKLKEKNHG